ncbi:MAG: 2Fe-2S iron-sulfur cluster binding domain-containing protein [Lentisphaerales bacterium]|nr:2Fe-2S iron-sulfur cluster binding domain-containing protein [Lentisphaerales bacterium]
MIYKINFTRSGRILEYCSHEHANLSILDLAFDNDVQIKAGCRSGYCSACQVEITKGDVKYFYDPPPVPADGGAALLCSCYPVSDLEING